MRNKNVIEGALDMTVAEFFEKMKETGKYAVSMEAEHCLWASERTTYGDTPIDISMIIDDDILFYSPFRFLTMDCISNDYFNVYAFDGSYRISCLPDEKISSVIDTMIIHVDEHYRILFRNIKRVKDSGRRYIIDPHWNKNEYEYLYRNAEKHGIKYVINWEDCHGYMIITDIDIDNDQHIELTTYQYDRVKGY